MFWRKFSMVTALFSAIGVVAGGENIIFLDGFESPLFRDCPECPQMIYISEGSFLMGDVNGGGDSDEVPVRIVNVPSFAVGIFEVTWDEWQSCVENGGCSPIVSTCDGIDCGTGRQPVVGTDWFDTQSYVAWLSQLTGERYRLLSEAEWEYVARAGTTTRYSWGNQDPVSCDNSAVNGANFANCSQPGASFFDVKAEPVGSYSPNSFGLYDVHGNVFEWVEDCYNTTYFGAPIDGSPWLTSDTLFGCDDRVVRGGSWVTTDVQALRSAYRSGLSRAAELNTVGLRVARDL